jgi:DNA-binding CsgD family transcriptional regulator
MTRHAVPPLRDAAPPPAPPDRTATRRRRKGGWTTLPITLALAPLLAVQIVGAAFFIFRTLADLFAWSSPIIPWAYFELLEVIASLGMVGGVIATVLLLLPNLRRMHRVQEQLDAAAGQLQVHIERLFDQWALTESERDVALLVIKGFSNGEISTYRKTSESTTKSQVSAIFRKSGLSNRQQLVSLVVEDLLDAIGR